MKKIRLFLVDDHQMLLDGLKALLENEDDFDIVGMEKDPIKALERIKQDQPDIVLSDINMKGMSGIELASKLKLDVPSVKILALSMHGERQLISDMMNAGAHGYILKNTGKGDLLNALYRLYEGQQYFSPEVTAELLKPQPQETDVLTTREKEIVVCIAKEYSNAQIAEQLFISERTVETHRKNIFRKTATKSVIGLINWARENGVVK